MNLNSYILRDYQESIRQRVLDVCQRHSSIMVQMPTGTGKTHLLASVIYDHLKEEQGQTVYCQTIRTKTESATVRHDGEMETIVTHDKLLDFSDVQLLEAGSFVHCRTKILYKSRASHNNYNIFDCGFYVRICDYLSAPKCRQIDWEDARLGHDSVCILAGDYETYYRYCGMLADWNIVVEDASENTSSQRTASASVTSLAKIRRLWTRTSMP